MHRSSSDPTGRASGKKEGEGSALARPAASAGSKVRKEITNLVNEALSDLNGINKAIRDLKDYTASGKTRADVMDSALESLATRFSQVETAYNEMTANSPLIYRPLIVDGFYFATVHVDDALGWARTQKSNKNSEILFLLDLVEEQIKDIVFELKDLPNEVGSLSPIDALGSLRYKSIVKSSQAPSSQRADLRERGGQLSVPDLISLLESKAGLAVGRKVTAENLKLAAETAFKAVSTNFLYHPQVIIDPETGLQLPPKRREIDFQCRGRGASGKRMALEEYLSDKTHGWGDYTAHHLLTASWINELDRPLYLALMYQANKEADKANVAQRGPERTAANDAFLLKLGILTTGHLAAPPPGLDRQVQVLRFVTRQRLALRHGRRHGRAPSSPKDSSAR
jgi:hypothetical protein